MKALAGVVGGLVVAGLTMVLISTTLAAFGPNGMVGAASFFILWASGIYVGLKSSSPTAAWRDFLLTSSILSFSLPLAGMVYTGSFMATNLNPASKAFGAQAAGAMIGGGIITTMLGFAGFFLGIAFLVPGLLLWVRSKKVASDDPEGNETETTEEKVGFFGKAPKAAKCPHCGGVVPLTQPECNHCLNRLTWINGKAFRPSRPAS